MTIVSSREQYLETGLAVLAEVGYGGLKLAEVCRRLGVTTGSFYHRFSSWQQFVRELGRYWADTQTEHRMDQLREVRDPRLRLEQLANLMKEVPHRTEAAIRTWATVAPEIRELLREVDQKRLDYISTIVRGVLPEEHSARLFGRWALYMLIGYQDALIDADLDALVWATDRVVSLVHADAPNYSEW